MAVFVQDCDTLPRNFLTTLVTLLIKSKLRADAQYRIMHAATAAALAEEGGKKGFLKSRAPTDAAKVKSASIAAAAAFR